MKNLKFVLGFVTGAIVVYLALYRPLKAEQSHFDNVMDEASRRMTEFEAQQAQQEEAHPYLSRRSTYFDKGWEDVS